MAQSAERRYLENARKLIADRPNWTKGAFSRVDEEGHWSYCAVGAIWKVAGLLDETGCYREKHDLPAVNAAIALAKAISPKQAQVSKDYPCVIEGIIGAFNDNATHEQILAIFSKALKNV